MYLSQISIYNLRNLQNATLNFSPQFNLFWGENGSGKTSLLESIHILTSGRSFRTSHAEDYIHFKADSCTVTGQARSIEDITPFRLGIERNRKKLIQIRINEENCSSLAQLTKVVPLQLINTESYQLLNLPPKRRRQFIDWGVFHVEPSFFPMWVRYHRALKQRNAALKRVKMEGEAAVYSWDNELIEAGERIHHYRKVFLKTFYTHCRDYLNEFLNMDSIEMVYESGWQAEETLTQALKNARGRDLAWGYTTSGPHRADVRFLLAEAPVESILSRGQLKLFVCALFLARGTWLKERTNQHAVFLLDDIASELDNAAILRLLKGLRHLGGQVLLTSIERPSVSSWIGDVRTVDFKMFHVEQGSIHELVEGQDS